MGPGITRWPATARRQYADQGIGPATARHQAALNARPSGNGREPCKHHPGEPPHQGLALPTSDHEQPAPAASSQSQEAQQGPPARGQSQDAPELIAGGYGRTPGEQPATRPFEASMEIEEVDHCHVHRH